MLLNLLTPANLPGWGSNAPTIVVATAAESMEVAQRCAMEGSWLLV